MRKYPPQLYDGHPPHEHTSTSALASRDIADVASTVRGRVALWIQNCGVRGATDDEIEIGLGLRHQTASARRRELYLLGHLVEAGARRTSSGRLAVAWRWKYEGLGGQGDASHAPRGERNRGTRQPGSRASAGVGLQPLRAAVTHPRPAPGATAGTTTWRGSTVTSDPPPMKPRPTAATHTVQILLQATVAKSVVAPFDGTCEVYGKMKEVLDACGFDTSKPIEIHALLGSDHITAVQRWKKVFE